MTQHSKHVWAWLSLQSAITSLKKKGRRRKELDKEMATAFIICFRGLKLLLSETTQHMAARGFAPQPPHKASVLLSSDEQQATHPNLGRRYFHKKRFYKHLGNLVLTIQNSGTKFGSNVLFP